MCGGLVGLVAFVLQRLDRRGLVSADVPRAYAGRLC